MVTLPEILEMIIKWAAVQESHVALEMSIIAYLMIGGEYNDQKFT